MLQYAHKYRNTMPATLLFLLLSLVVQPAQNSWAQSSEGIAAIVNDDVISRYDLNSRIRFIMFSSRLPNNQKNHQRLKRQVLSGLINERLKLQEAKRKNIKVTRKQVDAAIERVEKRNKLPKGGLLLQFQKNNIDVFSYERQIETDLAWGKIIRREISKSGAVSPAVIEQQIELMRANKGKPEYLVAEIYIPFDAARTSAEFKIIADRIRNQVNRGVRFSNLARSFSQSASAARGGSLGWIREDQLDPALSAVLRNLKRGALSAPTIGTDGYYILQLKNKRIAQGLPGEDSIVSLERIFLPLEPNAQPSTIQNQLNLARSIKSSAQNCQNMKTLGEEIGPNRSGSISDIRISSIAPNLRKLAQTLEIEKASDPIRTDTGILVIMVCNRKPGVDEREIRQRIALSMSEQKAGLLSRRLLRNLRQSAFIDIRK